jgi:alkanesulfonate monooxygenase SsuD/methylene tetrahydromethanopterin reductase-like flavin-dependent oxidoreductase (luciferase family)
MLDHMSGGRLEIGFGRGSVPFEISYYGQNAEERQQIYAERLELILKAFTVKTLTWKGRYDQFENVPMEMEPFQKPHPPLWYGAHSPDSAERAARKGLNMVTNDMPDNARAIVARYRQIWRDVQGPATLPKMGVVRFIVVADSDAKAMTIARRAYPLWHRHFHHLFRMHGTSPAGGDRPAHFDQIKDGDRGIAGSPATVLHMIKAQMQEADTNYFVAQFAFGDLTLAEVMRTVDLFAREVMPALSSA